MFNAVGFNEIMMLRHIGEIKAADRLEKAIAAVIAEGKSVTYDMKARRDDPHRGGDITGSQRGDFEAEIGGEVNGTRTGENRLHFLHDYQRRNTI